MIKVLVVDDSALIRSLLSAMIESHAGFKLVGTASDAYSARDMVNKYKPDVITLDIEMPRINGLVFLEKLMKARPTPVVMISNLTEQGAEATLRALELGAIDYIAKPKIDIRKGIQAFEQEIINKIRLASTAKVKMYQQMDIKSLSMLKTTSKLKLIGIGASTGGTEAIRAVLCRMPVNSPGIIITQHMPVGFTKSFADRLNRQCQLQVKEAETGEKVLSGHAYIAPGNQHLHVKNVSGEYIIQLYDGPRVSGHKPSVDEMFMSMAKTAGANSMAVILTGMGRDGTAGIESIALQGGYTIAQDEETSLIFGMPHEAIKSGKINKVLPLQEIGEHIINSLNLPS